MRYFSLRKINEKKGWNVLRGQSFQLTGGNRFSHQRITVITSGRNIRRRGFDLRLRLTVEGVGRGAISRISTCRPIKINVKSNCRSILSFAPFPRGISAANERHTALEQRNLESTYARWACGWKAPRKIAKILTPRRKIRRQNNSEVSAAVAVFFYRFPSN